MSVSSDFPSTSMTNTSMLQPASLATHPQSWTKGEVTAWLRWCTEEYSIEPIPPEKFDLNGKALCLLTKTDFMDRIPRNGDVLYNSLIKLISKHQPGVSHSVPESKKSSASDRLYQTSVLSHPNLLIIPHAASPPQLSGLHSLTYHSRPAYVPIRPNHPHISPHEHDSCHGQSSVNGDMIFDELNTGAGNSPECRLLWEFIHLLLSNRKYTTYVSWENQEDYVFRINNPTGLAELWGQQKNRSNMTYEKLSRALRYYYRMNIIKKVPGKRLTYRFLQSPSKIQKGQRGAKPHYKLSLNELEDTDIAPDAPKSAPAAIKLDPDQDSSNGSSPEEFAHTCSTSSISFPRPAYPFSADKPSVYYSRLELQTRPTFSDVLSESERIFSQRPLAYLAHTSIQSFQNSEHLMLPYLAGSSTPRVQSPSYGRENDYFRPHSSYSMDAVSGRFSNRPDSIHFGNPSLCLPGAFGTEHRSSTSLQSEPEDLSIRSKNVTS
ncbi:transcription factor ETV6-like isoform X2 [Dreissena polymorpha]|uniref:transcription factor ETV6-like isoform X2 n=1 Tax=Dreissena polymorpha TaxID=45954 RepID=UPI0022653C5A|nr:transcription factor ETV6-like isoform X2 [Dreissena polymorpha]